MADGAATGTRRRRAQQPAATPASTNPVEIAMEAQASGAEPQGVAAALLADQRKLIQSDLIHRRWQIASERAGFVLKAGAVALGLAAVGLLAAMAYQASRADGIVIEPFATPPALAERGLTGEVVASQLMDELSIAAEASSTIQQRSIEANFGEVSIQIPQTGVSLAQLEQWLREKLGHQTHVRGELVQLPGSALAIRVRAGGKPLPTVTGPEADAANLVRLASEEVLKAEQPMAYAPYLQRQPNRDADMVAWLNANLAGRTTFLRRQARAMLASRALQVEGDLAARPLFVRAEAAGPSIGTANFAALETRLGHSESAYELTRRALAFTRSGAERTEDSRGPFAAVYESLLAQMRGDYATYLKLRLQYDAWGGGTFILPYNQANAYARLHDLSKARRVLSGFEPGSPTNKLNVLPTQALVASQAEDWPALEAVSREQIALQEQALPDHGVARPTATSRLALSLAKQGRQAEAATTIAGTPLDCEPCLRVRGWVAESGGDRPGADRWFTQAVTAAPSLPQALYEWGTVKLTRGDAAGAEALFRRALSLSPRYPDAMAGLGEALLRQGKPAPAIDRLTDAAKLTPKWGRVQLLWGEALAAQGRTNLAKARWRTAAGLDLTPAERARLTVLTGPTPPGL